MQITDILNLWQAACNAVGKTWYLHRETLLCANGLDIFPAELDTVQVILAGTPADWQKIRANLPPDWKEQSSGELMHLTVAGRSILTVEFRPDAQPDGTIHCAGTDYPVFDGWRQYLEDAYGDYEAGMTDEIGVGLTAADKVELRRHQARCVEALAFLQTLCEEFGLRYYLLAGSVLGAVRHGGFIPWDDDIDVGIRIEDLDRFEQILAEALPQRLPTGFTLEQPGVGHPYPRMFSKLCFEGRCCMDLWPLVPTKSDGATSRFIWYFSKLMTKAHYEAIGYRAYKNRTVGQLLHVFLRDRQAIALARWNERQLVNRNAPAYINLYSIYSRAKETIPRAWLDVPETAQFEGISVPVVGCTEAYLTHLYGDFRKLPAPWKRASRHVERFGKIW